MTYDSDWQPTEPQPKMGHYRVHMTSNGCTQTYDIDAPGISAIPYLNLPGEVKKIEQLDEGGEVIATVVW